MNENINLTQILKDCPKGTRLYTPLAGKVYLVDIKDKNEYQITVEDKDFKELTFDYKGRCFTEFKDGECLLFPAIDQRDWSKFTAPWYKKERDTISLLEKQGEQEEPQVYETKDGKIITYSETDGYKFDEPKFHKGQWIACNGLNTALIIDIVDNKYEVEFLDGNKGFPHIDYVDRRFHLWTIQDAKDGDVLVNGSNIFIFHFINNRRLMGYCHVNMDDGNFYNDIGKNECFGTIDAPVTPATKEQHDAMMKAMNDAGYKWNAKTKTLEELIKPKFDPNTLQPFDKVIARNFNDQIWHADIFSHVEKDEDGSYYNTIKNDNYIMLIPYNDDTKHLVGTSLEAPEYYIYWED